MPSPFSPTYGSGHIIMTYCALLSLSILRDPFTNPKFDRKALVQFVKSCQRQDGSFTTVPGDDKGENDLRCLYCAFAISEMLNCWDGIDVPKALDFVSKCRTPSGGYGQEPFCEPHAGMTFVALASLYLAPLPSPPLPPPEIARTTRHLLSLHHPNGGFSGRLNKPADACYSFWAGAALKILGQDKLVDGVKMREWLLSCQFKFGGIARTVGEFPDPYHTYLSLAAMAMYADDSSQLPDFDPLLNCTKDTANWARNHIPASDHKA